MTASFEQTHSVEDVNSLIESYKNGDSSVVLAKRFGVAVTAIFGCLRRNGVVIRNGSEAARLYSCDHTFFDQIDSEPKAYWLGFLAADGYVNAVNSIAIVLKADDYQHLHSFAGALNSNYPVRIYQYGPHPFAKIVIKSPQLSAALARFGVVARKSTSIRWPTELTPDMIRHFARGFFDGNGGYLISRQTKGKTERISLNLTSTVDVLEGFSQCMTQHCGLPPATIMPAWRTVYYLRYTHREAVRRIADFMYDGASIYLPRKHERVYDFLHRHPVGNYPLISKHRTA